MSIETELNISKDEIDDEQEKNEIVITNENSTLMKRSETDSLDDYNTVRNSMIQTISAGRDALEGILQVAQDTDSPRAYEVFATLMKNLAETSEKLLQVHKTIKDIHRKNISTDRHDNNLSGTLNQQNNYFVGSTTDLQRYITDTMDNAIPDSVVDVNSTTDDEFENDDEE